MLPALLIVYLVKTVKGRVVVQKARKSNLNSDSLEIIYLGATVITFSANASKSLHIY